VFDNAQTPRVYTTIFAGMARCVAGHFAYGRIKVLGGRQNTDHWRSA